MNDSLVMTNAPAMSPAGGADCQASQPSGGVAGAGGDVSSGALSPNALSQNSQNAPAGDRWWSELDPRQAERTWLPVAALVPWTATAWARRPRPAEAVAPAVRTGDLL